MDLPEPQRIATPRQPSEVARHAIAVAVDELQAVKAGDTVGQQAVSLGVTADHGGAVVRGFEMAMQGGEFDLSRGVEVVPVGVPAIAQFEGNRSAGGRTLQLITGGEHRLRRSHRRQRHHGSVGPGGVARDTVPEKQGQAQHHSAAEEDCHNGGLINMDDSPQLRHPVPHPDGHRPEVFRCPHRHQPGKNSAEHHAGGNRDKRPALNRSRGRAGSGQHPFQRGDDEHDQRQEAGHNHACVIKIYASEQQVNEVVNGLETDDGGGRQESGQMETLLAP